MNEVKGKRRRGEESMGEKGSKSGKEEAKKRRKWTPKREDEKQKG